MAAVKDKALAVSALERELEKMRESQLESHQEMEKMRESHQFLAHELSAAATEIAETDDDILTAS